MSTLEWCIVYASIVVTFWAFYSGLHPRGWLFRHVHPGLYDVKPPPHVQLRPGNHHKRHIKKMRRGKETPYDNA